MYLLFDIGATKIRIAGSRDLASFSDPIILETPSRYEEALRCFSGAAKKISLGEPIKAVAGGVAGIFDSRKESLRYSHRQDWIGKPLQKDLSEIAGVPVCLENDAAIVGLGEAHFGAGKGSSIVAYVTVSTGVGGARIVNGVIDANRGGFEPGHQIVDAAGALCAACGTDGRLESFVSGLSLERRYGKKPYNIMDQAVWRDVAHYLAAGLANTILHWSPDVVVLGGSMIMGDPAIPIGEVEKKTKELIGEFFEPPMIRKANFKDTGGIYGAMKYLEQKTKQ